MAYFEELEVWQDAKTMTLSVYQMMNDSRDFGFRDQIQRASISTKFPPIEPYQHINIKHINR
jgi:four helix bundle protein